MANLNLDQVKVNTSLAEKYLKDHKNFEDWPQLGKYWHIEKYPNEKAEYYYAVETDKVELRSTFVDYVNTPVYVGKKLAKKIEEKQELLTQLEYMIRKTDAADVKNNIKLLSQHLMCSSTSWNIGNVDCLKLSILVNGNTPLCALGCVAIALYESKAVVKIVTTKEMAPLCLLFTELCHEVGWTVPLIFACDTEEYKKHLTEIGNDAIVSQNEDFRCTGVITESADIDSALDVLMNASVTAPWKLQRIYVQESIYEEVKGVLAWKGTRHSADGCGDAFAVRGTTFVCDEMGSADGVRVPLEAYRTSKELCALLAQHPPACLSLWASDAQQSTELSITPHASFVWINDYATFDGPPQVSLPIYRTLYPVLSSPVSDASLKKLANLKTSWTKLTENERIDVILDTLKDDKIEKHEIDRVRQYQKAVQEQLADSFVFADGGRVCYGVSIKPKANEYRHVRIYRITDLLNLFKAVVDGVAVAYDFVYACNEANNDKNFELKYEEGLLESLQNAGVPVAKCGWMKDQSPNIKHSLFFNSLKVISTNCGTIFAN